MIATAIRQIFNADSGNEARERLDEVVERLRAPAPKVAELLEEAEEDLLAFYCLPREHWTKLRSTNPLERVNKEIGRRSDVVGIYPNDQALIRLAGMLLSSRTTSGSSSAATSQTTRSASCSPTLRGSEPGGDRTRRGGDRPQRRLETPTS